MEYVLLMAGSITHAQRMAAMLENRGIRGVIVRAPVGLDLRGCGYGVRVHREKLDTAVEILLRRGIGVRSVWEKTEDGWREVVP